MALATAEQIKHLKLIVGAIDVTQPRESWVAPGLSDGIPKGAITEIIGVQKFEWFVAFLNQNPELKVFWAEKEQQILPTALVQRGIDLRRITFGVLGDDSFVSLRKVIQSCVYEVVIATNLFTDIKIYRAFQLLTEKSNTSLLLVSPKNPSTAWPIALQLNINGRAPSFKIEILKQRFGKTE